MGYEPAGYAALYSAPYHIGKTVRDDVMEYRKRSPVYHAKELATPLLIHTNTNDEDVNVLEVEHLIEALKAEGKTSCSNTRFIRTPPAAITSTASIPSSPRNRGTKCMRFWRVI